MAVSAGLGALTARDWFWGGILSVLFWAFVLPPVLSAVIPARWWMDVRQIYIEEQVPAGEVIRMRVDRTIHRNFTADYSVRLRKAVPTGTVTEDGGFHNSCRGGDAAVPYRTDAAFPDPLTLGWWIGTVPPGQECEVRQITIDGNKVQLILLPPGNYYAITTWEIPIWFGATLTIERDSNVFTVMPGSSPSVM